MIKKLFILSLFAVLGHFISQAQDSTAWSLQDCINYAVSNNITVKKKILDKQTTEVNYIQQQNNKLPSVSGSGSFTVAQGSTIDAITSSFVTETNYSNSYSVNGQLVLYQGNKLNLQIEKNAILVNQSKLYQKESENSIKLSVIEAYLQALYYYEAIQIAKNSAASSSEELKQTKVKFENGAIAKKDLADIETQHANNEYAVVAAQNQYNQQVLKLKQLLELESFCEFCHREKRA
ncbi:MAG: TolC family protein [Niabella sp.]